MIQGNIFRNNLFTRGQVELLAKALDLFVRASVAYDPPSVAGGAATSTTVAAVGARPGDVAMAAFSADLGGLMMTAHVSAADTVKVTLFNPTAGAIDLGAGTLSVLVVKS